MKKGCIIIVYADQDRIAKCVARIIQARWHYPYILSETEYKNRYLHDNKYVYFFVDSSLPCDVPESYKLGNLSFYKIGNFVYCCIKDAPIQNINVNKELNTIKQTFPHVNFQPLTPSFINKTKFVNAVNLLKMNNIEDIIRFVRKQRP